MVKIPNERRTASARVVGIPDALVFYMRYPTLGSNRRVNAIAHMLIDAGILPSPEIEDPEVLAKEFPSMQVHTLLTYIVPLTSDVEFLIAPHTHPELEGFQMFWSYVMNYVLTGSEGTHLTTEPKDVIHMVTLFDEKVSFKVQSAWRKAYDQARIAFPADKVHVKEEYLTPADANDEEFQKKE